MLPAPAGNGPSGSPRTNWEWRCSRRLRDGPEIIIKSKTYRRCSPRLRGWSPVRPRAETRLLVLPAPAGMNRPTVRASLWLRRASRARGDGPTTSFQTADSHWCSPRSRGWPPHHRRRHPVREVFPASSARMVPIWRRGRSRTPRATCTAGDGPWLGSAHGTDALLPAHAGMVPKRPRRPTRRRCVPRARGDGPSPRAAATTAPSCSPRPRGWSLDSSPGACPWVPPAPAGMAPRPSGHPSCAPRACGDGPALKTAGGGTGQCSPRAQGWSLQKRGEARCANVLPAPAGIVPGPPRHDAADGRAPRARGDGPLGELLVAANPLCSPCPRGWSRLRLLGPGQLGVLPAPAGMVPPARSW